MSREIRVIAGSAGLVAGAVLFFLVFAAIFVGSWALVIAFVLCYAAAGMVGVRVGGMKPGAVALLLAVPALPWILWLLPAAAREAGWIRALLWPGIAGIAGGLGWLGGRIAAPRLAGKPSGS